ncbi:MAG: TIM barrel protein [Spirochaetaceae bacterium]|nr:TIM barrel protein [Spirochaetaceae bacterium]
MLLALSGFLFEDRYRTQSVSFARFCRIARSAGYGGVELRRTQIAPDAPPDRRRELADIVRGEGLTVTCLTARGLPAGGDERDAFLDRYLELCADLDCRLLKISSDPAWLPVAAERAQAHGVMLAGNNHVGSALQTVAGTRRLLSQVAHRNYGLLYDSAHLYIAGEDYLGCIPSLLPHMRNVLMHSFRQAAGDEPPFLVHDGQGWINALPDARGVQDWPAILSACRRHGYDGLITVIESGWSAGRREDVARRNADSIHRWWDRAS